MKTLYKLNKWFELKIGWFFVNGNKRSHYNSYLKDKYKSKQLPKPPPINYPDDIFI